MEYEMMDIDSEQVTLPCVVFLDDTMEWKPEPDPEEEEDQRPVVIVRCWLAPSKYSGPVDWENLGKRRRCAWFRYWEPINFILKSDPVPIVGSGVPVVVRAPAPVTVAVVAPVPARGVAPRRSRHRVARQASKRKFRRGLGPSLPVPTVPTPSPRSSSSSSSSSLASSSSSTTTAPSEVVAPEVQAKRDAKKKELAEKQAFRDAFIANIQARKEQKQEEKKEIDWPVLSEEGDESPYMDECEKQIVDDITHANERRAHHIMTSTQPVSSALPPSPSPSASTTTYKSSTSTMQPGSHNPMEALQSSLISGKFSDLIIVHGTRKWQAHKVVVCSQSSGLESLIDKLQDTNILDLSEHDHEATVLMMEFLYTSNYSTTITDVAPSFSLPHHVDVFSLACTLSIPNLKALALQKYLHTLKNLVSNLSVYFASVRSIYSTPTHPSHPELKLAVVETAVLEMQNLLCEGSEQRREFLDLTSAVPQFQVDIYEFIMCNGNPQREVEVVAVCQELCEECGAREEGEGYEVTLVCKGCGEERTVEIL